jgi:sugar lactone lactonase YvrE/DNA-binding transcriptional ArsR family regulator
MRGGWHCLEKDSESRDFDTTKAELFEAISHPVRIKILEALNEKPMGFAELGRAVGIESGGHLSFHLTKLRHLIRTNAQGDYTLTGEGKEALWTIRALQKSGRETLTVAGRPPLRHRSLLKPLVAAILIAVVVLGGLGVYQQSQFSSLQRQVNSEQGIIGNLEGGIPFVNGQPASLVIGQKDFASNGLTTSLSGFNDPTRALFDSSGDLWVVDSSNSRVLEFRPPFGDGMDASLIIGVKAALFPAGSNSFYAPYGAAFDSSGNLWVSDQGNGRVLEFTPPFTTGMRASLVIGQTSFNGTDTILSRSSLNYPSSIAFDSSGSLWVADDDTRVLEYNPPFMDGMNASVVLGQPDFETALYSSTLRGLAAQAYWESGLAIDSSNDVWVGDPGNNRILEFRPPFTNGMNATFEIDQNNLVSNKTSFAGHGYMAYNPPYYDLGTTIAFDSRGNLWASYNNKLLAFKPPFIPEIRNFPTVEVGQPNFTTIAWLGGQAGLFSPGEAAFDSHGNLWIPDSNNNRILEFIANSGADATGQRAIDPRPIEYAVASSATVGVIGVLIATWFSRRTRGRPSSHSLP